MPIEYDQIVRPSSYSLHEMAKTDQNALPYQRGNVATFHRKFLNYSNHLVLILVLHKNHTLRIPPSKKHMICITAYDESRAIRDVKRGEVSPSRNTSTIQTVLNLNSRF